MVGAHSGGKVGFARACAPPRRRPRRSGSPRADCREILERLDLGHLADRPAAGLPFGTLKRIEFARALAASPGC